MRDPCSVPGQWAGVIVSALGAAAAQGAVSKFDLNPGADPSSPTSFVVLGDTAYFVARDNAHGLELWRTDGTGAGTSRVIDLVPGPGGSGPLNLSVSNGRLFFAAGDDSPATRALVYVSDGTAQGTRAIADLAPGFPPGDFFGPPAPGSFTPLNPSTTLFRAFAPATGIELYLTDGTPEGTRLLRDLHPGLESSIPTNLTVLNGVAYFSADDSVSVDPETGQAAFDRELWRTDGTPGGTWRVRDLNPGPASSRADAFVTYDNALFFAAFEAEGRMQVFRSDGTGPGTTKLTDFTGESYVERVVPAGGMLYFNAVANGIGHELYVFDPVTGTPRLVRDINRTPTDPEDPSAGNHGSYTREFTAFAGNVAFVADDGVHGAELWITDGTEAGTRLLLDLAPGAEGAAPVSLTRWGESLIFVSVVSAGDALYHTQIHLLDPLTLLPTLLFEAPGLYGGYSVSDLTLLGDRLLFSAPAGVDENGLATDVELHVIDLRAAVPEPAALSLLAAPAVLLGRRRR